MSTQPSGDRALYKWRRSPCPPPGGNQGTVAVTLVFPTDMLGHPGDDEATSTIAAPPSRHAAMIELIYTREPLATVEAVIGGTMLAGVPLPNGETFAVRLINGPWEQRDLWLGPTPQRPHHLVFPSRHAPLGVKRTAGIVLSTRVGGGTGLRLVEVFGYQPTSAPGYPKPEVADAIDVNWSVTDLRPSGRG